MEKYLEIRAVFRREPSQICLPSGLSFCCICFNFCNDISFIYQWKNYCKINLQNQSRNGLETQIEEISLGEIFNYCSFGCLGVDAEGQPGLGSVKLTKKATLYWGVKTPSFQIFRGRDCHNTYPALHSQHVRFQQYPGKVQVWNQPLPSLVFPNISDICSDICSMEHQSKTPKVVWAFKIQVLIFRVMDPMQI